MGWKQWTAACAALIALNVWGQNTPQQILQQTAKEADRLLKWDFAADEAIVVEGRVLKLNLNGDTEREAPFTMVLSQSGLTLLAQFPEGWSQPGAFGFAYTQTPWLLSSGILCQAAPGGEVPALRTPLGWEKPIQMARSMASMVAAGTDVAMLMASGNLPVRLAEKEGAVELTLNQPQGPVLLMLDASTGLPQSLTYRRLLKLEFDRWETVNGEIPELLSADLARETKEIPVAQLMMMIQSAANNGRYLLQ